MIDPVVVVLIGATMPAGAVVACPSTNWKTFIDGALTLLGEVRAMVEKMAAVEEAKKAAPLDALPPSLPSDGRRLPPPYVPPPNRAVFKRKH
jgi:hypothetical protein